MTVKLSVIFSIAFLMFSTLFSCSSTEKGTSQVQNNLEVLEAFQTPIVRGAGNTKGMRIALKVIKPNQMSVDSIRYEGITKPVNQLKSVNDTLWIDSYFYSNSDQIMGAEPSTPKEFSSKSCQLYFHQQNDVQQIEITDLKLETDSSIWE